MFNSDAIHGYTVVKAELPVCFQVFGEYTSDCIFKIDIFCAVAVCGS